MDLPPLLHHDTKDVGERLVKSTALVFIFQSSRILDYPMGKLMGDDVELVGEAVENNTVSVTKNHLLAVPKGVEVVLAEMYIAVKFETSTVNRISLEELIVEIVSLLETKIALVGILGWVFLLSDDRTTFLDQDRGGTR